MSYDFLRRAEKYSESRGHDQRFKTVYTEHRENFNVTEATWKTLADLYSDDVADEIEDQSKPCGAYGC